MALAQRRQRFRTRGIILWLVVLIGSTAIVFLPNKAKRNIESFLVGALRGTFLEPYFAEKFEKQDSSSKTKAVLGEGSGNDYLRYDDELKGLEKTSVGLSTKERTYKIYLSNGETYELKAPRCVRGSVKYYAVKLEYVNYGMVLPESYVGFQKTATWFKDRKGHDAGIYQLQENTPINLKHLRKNISYGISHQNSLGYATDISPNKASSVAAQTRLLRYAYSTYRAPGEEKFLGDDDDEIKELTKPSIINDFRITLRFTGVDSSRIAQVCRLQAAPILFTAPDKDAALRYSSVFNIPQAAATVNRVASIVRAPGEKKNQYVYKNDSDLDTRVYKYFLTSLGFDITRQVEIPPDAGPIYKARALLSGFLGGLGDKERPVPLVSGEDYGLRNYTIVPLKCQCVGEARRFKGIDFSTFPPKVITEPARDSQGRVLGTKYECTVDVGYPMLGNVDLPVSSKQGPAYNRGWEVLTDYSFVAPGELSKGTNLTVPELAYINCRMTPKAKSHFESKDLPAIRDQKKRELLKSLHKARCSEEGIGAVVSFWLSRVPYFIQTVPFELKKAPSTGGTGGSFSYGCPREMLDSDVVNEVLSKSKEVDIKVVSFLDPRIAPAIAWDRYNQSPDNVKISDQKKRNTVSALERLSCLVASNHKNYNWEAVVYVLDYDGGKYRLVEKPLDIVLRRWNHVKLPKCETRELVKF